LLKNAAWILITALGMLLIFVACQLIAVRGTFAPSKPAVDAGGSPILVGSAPQRIAGRVYLFGMASPTAPLVVVLHGDAPFVNPSYQYTFASQLARAVPGTRVAALLRPGYADPYGAKSDGDRGFASGENYTHKVIDQLAASIQTLQARWNASAVVLVGHSGGAALAADLSALHPGLVHHVFLVGCPCDVPAFRKHMAQLQWGPLWLLPVRSLSPITTIDQMQKSTGITAISGSNDPIALPQYAESYVAKARRLGISASMIVLPGQGHEILNDPAVVNAVADELRGEKSQR
jgi:pimeloyl-ACP methyl ester carboxylesterase